ncbi:INO80 complex subunit B-like [Haliotis rubra]|uniref:INO80 complex subunit B-like n=1 Tax=Haliotis rubra TaxID=36100 RepID=UPI001EE550D0|nr:INO80 complex subunit B-like [Haliotis rubra]
MGKRKEHFGSNEDESISESPGSSHKKHKKRKKKHKKRRDSMPEELEFSSPPPSTGGFKPAIKLKLKLGNETMGTKSFTSTIEQPALPSTITGATAGLPAEETYVNVTDEPWVVAPGEIPAGDDDTFKTKKPGDETSDEEKAWLDALEAGKLDDFEERQKHKDPKLLTARQRALIHGKQEEELMQLPSGYKNVQLTEEQLQRRQQRAKKRRQQAHEKREKDKKQTLDRLLKKQESKQKGPRGRGSKRANIPRYHYSSTSESITISVPVGYNFPFPKQAAQEIQKTTKCGVRGCSNHKKYSCSKTGVALCSLECYKTNLALHSQGNLVPPT